MWLKLLRLLEIFKRLHVTTINVFSNIKIHVHLFSFQSRIYVSLVYQSCRIITWTGKCRGLRYLTYMTFIMEMKSSYCRLTDRRRLQEIIAHQRNFLSMFSTVTLKIINRMTFFII